MKIFLEPWKILALHSVEARIRESYCVDHPAIELRNSWRRSALSGLGTYCLGYDSAEGIEIHHALKLATVGGRPRSEKEWILKF
jgi:hypothetical protein